MSSGLVPLVVVPDASPLIHLAAVAHLHLLQAFGRVVVVDMVAHEVSADPTRPWAQDVARWLANGVKTDSSLPVEIAMTGVGEAYRLARITDPTFRLRNLGERSIRDWLLDELPAIGVPAFVIYEDKRVPRLLEREPLGNVVIMATTRAMLGVAEERGLIVSAEDLWTRVIDRAASANPSSTMRIMRPR